MKLIKIYFPIMFLIGCASSIKPPVTTPVALPTVEQKAQQLSKTFTENDITAVELEPSTTTAGQNGELQVWLDAGKQAPYSGVLINTEGLAYVISEHDAFQQRAEAALKSQRELDLSKLNLEAGKLIIQIETIEKQNDVIVKGRDEEIKRLHELNDQVLKEAKKPLTKIIVGTISTVVGLGAGVLIGALLVK